MKSLIPFSVGGERGAISVRIARNAGARSSGFDVLGRMKRWDVAGFPVLNATVRFAGKGYRGLFGWIQVVELDFPRDGKTKTLVDVVPSCLGLGVPFVFLGPRPALFDAPARRPRSAGTFRAESFLCRPPLLSRAEPVRFAAGFRWGYEIAPQARAPRLIAVSKLGRGVWNARRALLAREYPRWTFG